MLGSAFNVLKTSVAAVAVQPLPVQRYGTVVASCCISYQFANATLPLCFHVGRVQTFGQATGYGLLQIYWLEFQKGTVGGVGDWHRRFHRDAGRFGTPQEGRR